jgi:cellulose synthase/poly-beta-1,6-N-acetylglucosamine synthase-like glycosyltransferase
MTPEVVSLGRRGERTLELLVGSATWVLMSAPLWAAFLIPEQWLYLFTAFSLYWLYRSLSGALFALVAWRRISVADAAQWLAAVKRQDGWRSIRHLVVFPSYNEPLEVLRESLRHVAAQDFPTKRVYVLLALEARDPSAAEKARSLRAQFEGAFADILVTYHPEAPGEPHGKASNLAYAIPAAREKLERAGWRELNRVLVTICDADSRLHPKYLSALSYSYLADPQRDFCLYQPAMLLHANSGRIPFFLRPVNGLHSVVQVSRMPSPHKLITQSTYSLSLAACHEIDYWDAHVVPEDSHTFFKMFFKWGTKTRVHPIYLPVLADAAEGLTWWRTVASHYRQARRWSWGVSDVPFVVAHALRARHIPLWERLWRAWYYTKEHVLWPSHWFLLTGGLSLIPSLAPQVAAGTAFREMLTLSSSAIAVSAASLLALLWIDTHLSAVHAPEPQGLDRWLGVIAWAAVPLVGFVVVILPAVEAHTRLLLGRGLRFEVTEKRAPAEGMRAHLGRLLNRADHWAA